MAQITVKEVANASISIFTEECLNKARENWSENQVKMLERLFESCERGCQYKCVECKYLGRIADAPETVPEDCMWEPDEEDAEGFVIHKRPCEDD